MKKILYFLAAALTLAAMVISCEKEPKEVKVTGVKLDQTSLQMFVGDSQTLTATVQPADAKATVEWSTSDASVATVSNGVVTAVAAGSATITAKADSYTATCTVTVTKPAVVLTGIKLDQASIELLTGDSQTLVATLEPAGAEATVEWSTSDAAVATVSEGVVTAVAAGSATITAKAGSFTASCEVTVKAKVTGVSLDPTSAEIIVGETKTLTATIEPAEAEATVEWSSSDEAVATVSEGVVTAVAVGSATITAKAGDVSATCEVTVIQPELFGAIDGDFSEWEDVKGVTEGNHTFKVAYDDYFVYFYSYRTSEGRYSDIWGGGGYVYVGMDLDGDETNGETLWGNGPYDFVGVIYPFGGSADAPEVVIAKSGACLPETCTVDNVVVSGVAAEDGVRIEYRIPRADLPPIPESEVTIKSWGNKDMSKATLVVNFGGEETSGVKIDGDFSDWADIAGVTEGNHTFKAASDAENIYFFSHRDADSRYPEIWGGAGYVYVGMDLDGDPTNGETLWSQGPYDFVGVIFPFGGSVEAPEIVITGGSTCLPDSYTLNNVVVMGAVAEDGVNIEYSIPRADLPAIPNSEITIKSWGNKGMSKSTLVVTL